MVPQINGPQNVASGHSTHSPRKALEILLFRISPTASEPWG